ncbi:MAG: valine--tRNA ligase [Buchnera aphidicola (Kaburagia rhusicola rhusicola)]
MKKSFNPFEIERTLYDFWEKNGYFKPNLECDKPNFCIILPPPNITGNLHIGHAFQYTIMDILIRYHRMQGKNTFCQVGTDHAGIATQIILEKKILLEEKKTIRELGKDNFIKKAWQWKEESVKRITNQMRRLGISVDWTKIRFTLDSEISDAVRKAFIILYNQKLIYKRKKIVNWDPMLKTVVSDLEVQNRDCIGKMWYIKYTLVNDDLCCIDKTCNQFLIIATTRPETLFGDTAIAVNPNDVRYKKLIGKKVLVPLINRVIPVIGDHFVQMEKGTGCMKITPAHDFNDFEIGVRHNLPMINILTLDGNISHIAQEYNVNGLPSYFYSEEIPFKFHNMNRFLARKEIINELMIHKKLEKVEVQNLTIPYGDRSDTVLEPLLTDQWYLNVTELAKQASQAVANGDITFISKQYENMYFSWMSNIQDWCISRQLWWGHQVPVWYDEKNNIYVGNDENDVRKVYKLPDNIELKQDSDVLDTWFSSGLWVFSSLGWPEDTSFLKHFYPTNVIVSGFDIIFFWIARMIMLSMHFIKDSNGKPKIPFKAIYITGLICDESGQKMSKSKGNVIDPLDMIDGITLEKLIQKRTENTLKPNLKISICQKTKQQFPNGVTAVGTDALRFTCAILSSPTRYINWNVDRLYGYRNFCNKLWNASRFVLLNIDKQVIINDKRKMLSIADQWILLKLNIVVKRYRYALDTYRFDIASSILYEFVWKQFCDFYIELVKSFITSCSRFESVGTKHTLFYVLESILCLAHPIIPFITEEIWQKFRIFLNIEHIKTIMLCQFPRYDVNLKNDVVIKEMKWIKRLISIIRQSRIDMNLPYQMPISIYFCNVDLETCALIKTYQEYIKKILYLKDIHILTNNQHTLSVSLYSLPGAELLIPILGYFSEAKELKKIKKEISEINLKIEKLKIKLLNKNFLRYAPYAIVNNIKSTLFQYQSRKQQLLLKKSKLL